MNMKLFLILASAVALSACAPKPVDSLVEVGPSDIAFVVPLQGENLNSQKQVYSEAYLEANRVQARRIVVKHVIIDKCPTTVFRQCYEDAPSAKVFLIRRSPVTRDWTSSGKTGTTAANQSFTVESVESIDFSIGATITAHVDDKQAAKFLYNYNGLQLEKVIDTNVRSYISTILSKEFGVRTYDKAREEKVAIFDAAFKDAKEFFLARGITIDNLGYTDGMTPGDARIQQSINDIFTADRAVEAATKQARAARELASAAEAVKQQQEQTIRLKASEALLIMANKWNGQGVMPQYVITNDGKVVTSIPVTTGK